jgi:hypothetical protein
MSIKQQQQQQQQNGIETALLHDQPSAGSECEIKLYADKFLQVIYLFCLPKP